MNLSFKILIGFFVVALLLIASAFVYIKKSSSIDDLVVNETDSINKKIVLAKLWLNKLQKDKKFNGAVLLIKNDKVILKETYGFTDNTKKIALTNNSSFRLASVSKQFTAAGIMLLKEQGKLNFDDSITKYLPQLSYNTVTIRNLLNHTSGVPDIYMNFESKYKKEIDKFLSISKMVDLLAKENKPLTSKPNEKYRYNNTGYVLLAAIVESISKKSFEDFMQEELFSKLKMKNTRVWNLASKDSTFKNKTSSFEYILGKPYPLEPSILDGVAGDGGVFSSINDFVIWNQFWHQNEFLSKETMHEAFKEPILNDDSISDYGFGWIITKNKAMWHNGSWLGARTMIIRNPQLKNCLVILDNSSSKNIDKIAEKLVQVFK
ncbi:serine hydrolase domain-containing protein [Polaribacter porphyrae]|uniref:Beta-lactamase-related domain-containing protein n=1 Tax=Polaribacter porphyrae TaxID=1137780 RepID=A0A2S7WQ85_9FLAO|nr:serine hydrolase domain-containing protein [Polaribacter porphyrae]PQJ79778.1 hypothetical protein BTO18_11590 [Polaribacter porphyrae]